MNFEVSKKELEKIFQQHPLITLPKNFRNGSHPFLGIYNPFFFEKKIEGLISSVNDVGEKDIDVLIKILRDKDLKLDGPSYLALRVLEKLHKKISLLQSCEIVVSLHFEDFEKDSNYDNTEFFSTLFKSMGKKGLFSLLNYLKFVKNRKETGTTVLNLIEMVINSNKQDKDCVEMGIFVFKELLKNAKNETEDFNGFLMWMICASYENDPPTELFPLIRKAYSKNLVDLSSVGGFDDVMIKWGEKFVDINDKLVRKCHHCSLPHVVCRKRKKKKKKKNYSEDLEKSKLFFQEKKYHQCIHETNKAISKKENMYASSQLLEMRSKCYFKLKMFNFAIVDMPKLLFYLGSRNDIDDVRKDDFGSIIYSSINKPNKNLVKWVWGKTYQWKKTQFIQKQKFCPHTHMDSIHISGCFAPNDFSMFVNNETCYSLSLFDLLSRKRFSFNNNIHQKVVDVFITKNNDDILLYTAGRIDYKVGVFRIRNRKKLEKVKIFKTQFLDDLFAVRAVESLNLIICCTKSKVKVFSKKDSCINFVRKICGFIWIRKIEVYKHYLLICDRMYPNNVIYKYDLRKAKLVSVFMRSNELKKKPDRSDIHAVGINKRFIVSGYTDGEICVFYSNDIFEKHLVKFSSKNANFHKMVTSIFVQEKTNYAFVGMNNGIFYIIDCLTGNMLHRCKYHFEQPKLRDEEGEMLNCVISSNLFLDKFKNIIIQTAGNDGVISVHKVLVEKGVCDFCKKENIELKKCSRCRKAFYCSIDHQKKHWKVHKRFCKAVYL